MPYGFNPVQDIVGLRDINGLTTGAIDLMVTRPTPFLPVQILVAVHELAGFTSSPTVSLGTNSPNYNNIVAATALNLSGLGAFRVLNITTSNAVARDSLIRLNITIVGVATTYRFGMWLLGYYV